jgi:hypothetical protein
MKLMKLDATKPLQHTSNEDGGAQDARTESLPLSD